MCRHSVDTSPSYCVCVLFLGTRSDCLTQLDASRQCVTATLSAYNEPPLPPKAPSAEGSAPHQPHLIYGSLDPPESPHQTASRSVQPFLQGSQTLPADRPNDRPRYSVRSNRSLSIDAVRPKHWSVFDKVAGTGI